ncbi:hypothetical protein [Streptomyces lydicus]|uniref:hypothetical protein n=1 Tax=Streptomyces lydicus TaxID=47763 RepID=UPI0037B310FA
MRPGRSRAIAATALALGTLLTTALPATAAEGPGPASRCTPALHVLDRLPGTGAGSWGSESVNDFGTGGLSVGQSAGLPAYWTGSTVHRVPLPSGYDRGSVAAVNHRGLMVGSIQGPVGVAAFSYRVGAAAVRVLPGGTYAADVNDRGTVAGGNDSADAAYLWTGATLTRPLTASRRSPPSTRPRSGRAPAPCEPSPASPPTARPAPRPSTTSPGWGVGPTTAIRTTAPAPRTP